METDPKQKVSENAYRISADKLIYKILTILIFSLREIVPLLSSHLYRSVHYHLKCYLSLHELYH